MKTIVILFCVLIFYSKVVVSVPYPDGANGQRVYQYPNWPVNQNVPLNQYQRPSFPQTQNVNTENTAQTKFRTLNNNPNNQELHNYDSNRFSPTTLLNDNRGFQNANVPSIRDDNQPVRQQNWLPQSHNSNVGVNNGMRPELSGKPYNPTAPLANSENILKLNNNIPTPNNNVPSPNYNQHNSQLYRPQRGWNVPFSDKPISNNEPVIAQQTQNNAPPPNNLPFENHSNGFNGLPQTVTDKLDEKTRNIKSAENQNSYTYNPAPVNNNNNFPPITTNERINNHFENNEPPRVHVNNGPQPANNAPTFGGNYFPHYRPVNIGPTFVPANNLPLNSYQNNVNPFAPENTVSPNGQNRIEPLQPGNNLPPTLNHDQYGNQLPLNLQNYEKRNFMSNPNMRYILPRNDNTFIVAYTNGTVEYGNNLEDIKRNMKNSRYIKSDSAQNDNGRIPVAPQQQEPGYNGSPSIPIPQGNTWQPTPVGSTTPPSVDPVITSTVKPASSPPSDIYNGPISSTTISPVPVDKSDYVLIPNRSQTPSSSRTSTSSDVQSKSVSNSLSSRVLPDSAALPLPQPDQSSNPLIPHGSSTTPDVVDNQSKQLPLIESSVTTTPSSLPITTDTIVTLSPIEQNTDNVKYDPLVTNEPVYVTSSPDSVKQIMKNDNDSIKSTSRDDNPTDSTIELSISDSNKSTPSDKLAITIAVPENKGEMLSISIEIPDSAGSEDDELIIDFESNEDNTNDSVENSPLSSSSTSNSSVSLASSSSSSTSSAGFSNGSSNTASTSTKLASSISSSNSSQSNVNTNDDITDTWLYDTKNLEIDLTNVDGDPMMWVRTTDKEFFDKLVDKKSPDRLYYIQVTGQYYVERHKHTTIYCNGTVVEEITETTYNNKDDPTPRVIKQSSTTYLNNDQS